MPVRIFSGRGNMKTITQEELYARIERHAKWLKDGSGERLVLVGYDLSYSNLSYSNLSNSNVSHSDLSYSYLSYSNLSYSDLSYSNVCGSYLNHSDLSNSNVSYSNLSYSDLSDAKGFYLLPIQDPRGYSFAHAVECKDGWRIRAGCRDFTIAEAKEHWGLNYKGDRSIGDDYLYAIEWLERKIK